jgi:uncharacterized membrane protein
MDAVRARLADLPPEEREDLLADTEASLLEAAEEEDAPLALRLGPPERFADELRAAAGLEPAGRPVRAGRLRELVAHPAVTRARAWARELAPVWWVARGYFLVGLAVLI